MGPDLDQILGFDPDPELGADGRRRLAQDVRQRIADGGLDELLELDADLDVPPGLGARVLRGLRPRTRSRRGLWVGAGAVLTAAAAATLMATWPWASGDGDPAPTTAQAAPDPVESPAIDAPSDELLAALMTLEDLEFLDAELEPIESDALFLLDEEDELLLDLLQGEDR